jgi:hypothetical protein
VTVRILTLRQLHEGRVRMAVGALALLFLAVLTFGEAELVMGGLVLLLAALVPLVAPLWFRLWRGADLRVDLEADRLIVREGSKSTEIDTTSQLVALRLTPRDALLRRGGWSYRLRLAEDAAETDLDDLMNQLETVSRGQPAVLALRSSGAALLLGVMGAVTAFVTAIAAAALLRLHDTFLATVLAPTLAALVGIPFVLGRSSLTIAEDGLLLREGRRRTFVSYRSLRSVGVTGDDSSVGYYTALLLRGVDGKERTVATRGERAEVKAIAGRIEAALGCHQVAHQHRVPVDLLARGQRSIARWRADLSGAQASFRQLALPEEELLAVLTDPGAPTEQRIGAGLALRGEARARIRVAAAASADPVVRVALEAVAEEEIDEPRLEAALRHR